MCRCDSSSPYIHPIGWCQERNLPLTPPQGDHCVPFNYPCSHNTQNMDVQDLCRFDLTECDTSSNSRDKNKMTVVVLTAPDYPDQGRFSWSLYLEETGSKAVPAEAFKVVRTGNKRIGFQSFQSVRGSHYTWSWCGAVVCVCGLGWQKQQWRWAQPEISGWKCHIMTCLALISPCQISNLAVYHEWSFSCRATALPTHRLIIHHSIYICISATSWSHYTYKFLFIVQFIHLSLTCPQLSHYYSTAAALCLYKRFFRSVGARDQEVHH